MESQTRVPGYDLFKLIVAIILLLIFLFLLRLRPSPAFLPELPTTLTAGPGIHSSTATSISDSSTSTAPPLPSPSATSTTSELTLTPIPLPTGTLPPTDSTATVFPTPSPTTTPLPTSTGPAGIEETATPLAETPAVSACDAATPRSRLQTGMNATILRRLNFRSSPGIRDNWILTNIPGTKVEVVGGPECVPYWTGAYLWWQIKLPDGRIGWSAEGSLHGSFYFMEPAQ
jgi:hypothetical protein